MIDEDRTLQLYGYTSDDLKTLSHKKVVCVCEECGKYRILPKYHSNTHRCLSCANSGENNPAYGKPITEETRRRMSTTKSGKNHPMYNKKHTSQSRKKMSDSKRGEKCYKWKGGITPVMSNIRNSPAYKNWRTAVFKRDDFTCMMCNDNTGGNLQAHHIHPVRDHKNDLSMFDIDNGITLCRGCHKSIGGRECDYVEEFEQKV